MIENEVKTILSRQFGIAADKIVNTDDLSALGADSLDLVEIVMDLEEHFKIEIEEHEYLDAITVEKIVQLIELKKNKKA
jgi:acyl carrier protein